jgi:hypothetical protein
MHRRRSLALGFALAAFIVSVAPVVHAQESDVAARVAEIKKRGDAAMDSGRPADALAAYVEAYSLAKEPALLYNKGRALQALGEYPQALEELEAFDKTAPPELKARVPGLAKMIVELRARVTTVSIACDTMAARVRLRDRTVGTCPLPPTLVVLAGHATLEVTAEGYFPYVRELDLPPGGVSSLDVRLASRATSGILVVKSNVANTVVTIDGKGFGMVPVEASLKPGPHALELRRDGYRPASTQAILAAGETKQVDVPLEAEGTIFGKWWFWTGVGVIVAGGVVVALALTTEKSPEPGTVPPGVVTGGLQRAGGGFRF